MSDLRLLALVLSGGFLFFGGIWLGRSAGSCCSGVYFPDPLAGGS